MQTALPPQTDDAFEQRLAQLALATPDGADPLLDPALTALLRLIREHLGMEVVFVTEYVGERNVFQRIEAAPGVVPVPEGTYEQLADSFCKRVVDGQLPAIMQDVAALRRAHRAVPDKPFKIGAYLSAPVRLRDGTLFGSLCCLSAQPQPDLDERDLRRLEMSARLIARLIEAARGLDEPPER